MSASDTAHRLQLPCPCCSRRGTLAAYVYGERAAVRCTACDHVWAERASLHVVLRVARHFQQDGTDILQRSVGLADSELASIS